IDYGPCAFLDEYDPGKTFSSIDQSGRYALSNQPRIALWNLARLADALLGLIREDREEAVRIATERLHRFAPRFDTAYLRVMCAKLGLVREERGDRTLVEGLLTELAAHRVDYTLFFRRLCDAAADPSFDRELISSFDLDTNAFQSWADAWRRRLALEADAP